MALAVSVTPAQQGIELKCQSCKRMDRVNLRGLKAQQAAMVAGLLDGSSPCYSRPPSGRVGKCSRCGGHFQASLFGYTLQ